MTLQRRVVVFVIFACIVAWLGKDGDFRGRAKRMAPIPRTEAAVPTLSFDEELRQLGLCIVATPDGVCVDDSVKPPTEEATRARTK